MTGKEPFCHRDQGAQRQSDLDVDSTMPSQIPASWLRGRSTAPNAEESRFEAELVPEEDARRKLQIVSDKYEELLKLHRRHAAAEARSTQASLMALKTEASALSGEADDSAGWKCIKPSKHTSRLSALGLGLKRKLGSIIPHLPCAGVDGCLQAQRAETVAKQCAMDHRIQLAQAVLKLREWQVPGRRKLSCHLEITRLHLAILMPGLCHVDPAGFRVAGYLLSKCSCAVTCALLFKHGRQPGDCMAG